MIENDHELDAWWERFIAERSRAIAKSMGGKVTPTGASPAGPLPIPDFAP